MVLFFANTEKRIEGNARSEKKEKGQVQDLPLHSDHDKMLDREMNHPYDAQSVHSTDIAKLCRCTETLDWIAFWDKLVPHIEVITRLRNRSHDGRIVDLLFLIQVMATGVARCVKVSNILDIVLERPDNVALHNLHVVDVVE